MIKKVLIVDDDQEMLLSLNDGLEKYNESFSIIMAHDGQSAIDKLKATPISLVVTDLKMPKVNGFAVLSFIMEHYPEIPVIIITAYGTPDLEKRSQEGGAVGWIEKPFMVDDLAKKIITTLRKESEGGTLHGVSSGMFLQLIEVEQKSCTIRLLDKNSGQNGVLFFKDGELLDARTNNLQGKDAALDIFSWDNVTLSIQNDCPIQEKKIQGELQAILLDAMRIKDENKQKLKEAEASKLAAKTPPKTPMEQGEPTHAKPAKEAVTPGLAPKEPSKEPPPKPKEEQAPSRAMTEILRVKLNKEFGTRSGVIDIYQDKSWDPLIKKFIELNKILNAKDFKVAYLDIGQASDFILMPDKSTVVITVNPKSPKDRLLQTLMD
ncbi:MAG: response regulator [Desulfobacteraceae bacterium]|nr:MAG: response regulator [Desulfobacteraceae bacterium]